VPDGFHGKVGWKIWKIGKGNHRLAIILTSRIVSWNKQVRLLQGLALKVEVAPLAYRGMILQPCNWYGHWGSTVLGRTFQGIPSASPPGSSSLK
jgi:hypothetical protein